MKTSKTRIALAVALFVNLHGYSTAQAAWWEGGTYTDRVEEQSSQTIEGNLTITVTATGTGTDEEALVITGDNTPENVKIDSNAVEIILGSENGIALLVRTAGIIDLSGARAVTITSGASDRAAIMTQGMDSDIIFGDGVIITQTNNNTSYQDGTSAHAVHASAGVIEFANRAQVTANAANSAALFAEYEGMITAIDNNSFTANGDMSNAAHAVLDGTIELGSSNTLAAKGDGSSSIYADGGTVNMGHKNTITVDGSLFEGIDSGGSNFIRYATGASAVNAGDVHLGDENVITTSGDKSFGLYAEGEDSIMRISDKNQIETRGEHAHGIYAVAGSDITIVNDNKIITRGDGSYGIAADGGDSVIRVGNNNTVEVHGDSIFDSSSINDFVAAALYSLDDAVIEAGEGNRFITHGKDANTVIAENAEIKLGDNTTVIANGEGARAIAAYQDSVIKLEGKQTIYSKESYALIAADEDSKIEAEGLLNITGSISAATEGSEVKLTFLADSYFNGVVDADAGQSYEPGVDKMGHVIMDMTDSRWDLTDSSHVTSLTLDNTHVYFNLDKELGAGRELTIQNLQGTEADKGGIFHMNSWVETGDVASGGSGTNITDKLILVENPDAPDGAGSHVIIVADRGGAKTLGTETITIVESEQEHDTFRMNAPTEQGGYLYGLRKVEGSENWELYGLGILSDTVKVPVDLMGARYMTGLIETQTLMQRMGDLRQSPHEYGAWVKLLGGKLDGKSTDLSVGYDLDYAGFQLGIDKKVEPEWLNGDFYVGLWGGYTDGDVDFNSSHTADIKNGFVGVYATYLDDSNVYADVVLKYGTQKSKIKGYSTQGTSLDGSDRTSMYGASLEVGKRFHFGPDNRDEGYYVEPQAQITFTHFGSTDLKLSNGLRVQGESFDSLIGRIGFNAGLERKYQDNPFNAYIKVSYNKELDGDVNMRFNDGTTYNGDLSDEWWSYGPGVSAKIADKHNVYIDLQRSSASNMFGSSWQVHAGYRFEF